MVTDVDRFGRRLCIRCPLGPGDLCMLAWLGRAEAALGLAPDSRPSPNEVPNPSLPSFHPSLLPSLSPPPKYPSLNPRTYVSVGVALLLLHTNWFTFEQSAEWCDKTLGGAGSQQDFRAVIFVGISTFPYQTHISPLFFLFLIPLSSVDFMTLLLRQSWSGK